MSSAATQKLILTPIDPITVCGGGMGRTDVRRRWVPSLIISRQTATISSSSHRSSRWLPVMGSVGTTFATLAYALWTMSRVDVGYFNVPVGIAADGSIWVGGIPDQLIPAA